MKKGKLKFSRMLSRALVSASVLIAGSGLFLPATNAQETGGALGGGAGIFRPKNPEAKRS
jgi:hypothetical protein